MSDPLSPPMPDPTLAATRFIDADHPAVVAFAAAHAGDGDDRSRAIHLHLAVRDGIRYDVLGFSDDPATLSASSCLAAGYGYCVPKAITLAAVARAAGIPSRLGFADVRNHILPPRLRHRMETDVFHWHAFTELAIEGRWVKATPAFDRGLCAKAGVRPLDFDGRSDSIFHDFTPDGRRHMEYVTMHGSFDDLPAETFLGVMRRTYPRLLEAIAAERAAAAPPAPAGAAGMSGDPVP